MAPAKQMPRAARRRRMRNRSSAFASVGGLPRAVALSPVLGQTYRMSRTLGLGLPKGAVDQGQRIDFALNDVPNPSEFTSLFQEWRLDSVHCHFIWVPSSTTGPTPRVVFSLNPTATAAPASELDLLQQRHTIWTTSPTSRDYCMVIRPRVTQLVGESALPAAPIANAVAPHRNFMSTVAPTISYGSLLIWASFFNSGIASSGDLNVQFTYNFVFRGLK